MLFPKTKSESKCYSDTISLMTQMEHLMSLMMGMLLEQMRIIQCRKMLEQQMVMNFCKFTKFGTLFKQLELLIQQFHGIFYHGVTGISYKGVPRLTLDTSGKVSGQILMVTC